MALLHNYLSNHSIRLSNIDGELGFWNSFYASLNEQNSSLPSGSTSQTSKYQDHVFSLLEDKKAHLEEMDDSSFKALQFEIEKSTLLFDSASIYKTSSHLLKKLIGPDKVNAKDYLWSSKTLDDDDLQMLSDFGPNIIECIIVHVFGLVFSAHAEHPIARLAHLVSQLDTYVRLHARFLRGKEPYSMKDLDKMISAKKKSCPIGNILVQFLEERGFICIVNDFLGEVIVKKKKGRYFYACGVYAQCNFDLSLLPIKLNLPMVCPPLSWKSALPEGQIPSTLRDLSGGYLNSLSGELYNRYRLLSTGNIDRFHIAVDSSYMSLCSVMNKLQGQAFQINSAFLSHLKTNEESLVNDGLLMPRFLASLNMRDVAPLLKQFHTEDSSIRSYCSYHDLLLSLSKQIQQSRYEEILLKIASAYDGYHFYLPAFLDFRGRIYRSGILHYHERDLARSLILFGDTKIKAPSLTLDHLSSLVTATAFHYKSFPSYSEGHAWFHNHLLPIDDPLLSPSSSIAPTNLSHTVESLKMRVLRELPLLPPLDTRALSDPSLLTQAYYRRAGVSLVNKLLHADSSFLLEKLSSDLLRSAKRPFQLLASSLGLYSSPMFLPITQDASASAYQIMSYFLLDECLAMKTNLIQSPDGLIQDVYTFILEELKVFMIAELADKNLSTIVCDHLTRKLVKRIFMPMLYGKKMMSTAMDIKKELGLPQESCVTVARACFKFWRVRYKHLYCLMELIGDIGWLVSSRGWCVVYRAPYFLTVQDYRRKKALTLYVKNRSLNKRHRVTLTMPGSDMDCRKTETATFVNFIHQRDASIAMKVVEVFKGPIYTIHDNFLTTVDYSSRMATIYNNVFMEMGPPLAIINEFIYLNVLKNPTVPGSSSGTCPLAYARALSEPLETLEPTLRCPADFRNGLISNESLRSYLSTNIPLNKKKSFEERISRIVRNYNTYTRLVCGHFRSPEDAWCAHLDKWERFKKGLQGEGGLRYSVHN